MVLTVEEQCVPHLPLITGATALCDLSTCAVVYGHHNLDPAQLQCFETISGQANRCFRRITSGSLGRTNPITQITNMPVANSVDTTATDQSTVMIPDQK